MLVSWTGQPTKRRPAVGVVRPERQPGAEQVAGHVGAAVGSVVARVAAERPGDPEAVEGLAVDDPPAGPHVGGDVEVGVDESAHRAVPVDGAARLTVGARRGVGVAGATASRHEPEAGGAPVSGGGTDELMTAADREAAGAGDGSDPKRPRRGPVERPLGRPAGSRDRLDPVTSAGGEQAPVGVVDQVAPEAGRLEEEALCRGPIRDDAIAVGRLGDVVRSRSDGEAAVGGLEPVGDLTSRCAGGPGRDQQRHRTRRDCRHDGRPVPPPVPLRSPHDDDYRTGGTIRCRRVPTPGTQRSRRRLRSRGRAGPRGSR